MTLETAEVSITSGLTQFPYIKRFSLSITISQLKKKLELIVGLPSEHMRIELRDKDGEFLASLSDDNATLQSLSIQNGQVVHVTDVSGGHGFIAEDSSIEHLRISEDRYKQIPNNIRETRLKELERMHMTGSCAESFTGSGTPLSHVKIGSRCIVRLSNQPEKHGSVSFVGKTHFKEGFWIGVIYDEQLGKNDGSVEGVRYFECSPKFGAFVRPQNVFISSYSPVTQDEPMEEM